MVASEYVATTGARWKRFLFVFSRIKLILLKTACAVLWDALGRPKGQQPTWSTNAKCILPSICTGIVELALRISFLHWLTTFWGVNIGLFLDCSYLLEMGKGVKLDQGTFFEILGL